LIDETNEWLSRLPTSQPYRDKLLRQLTDVLSLPAWGKRHDVYAAWIVTLFGNALPDTQLRFIVNDGIFAMPFRATHLADIDCPAGVVELWSELKSPLSAPDGRGRAAGIQPDYRFVQSSRRMFAPRTDEPSDPGQNTILAVEVKQYLKAAKKNPGQALADYTRGLPQARVFIAAYGPVSKNVLDYVPAKNRPRAHVFRDVQPHHSGAASLRDAVSKAIPTSLPSNRRRTQEPLPFMTVSVDWTPSVHDLDLYVSQGVNPSNIESINYQSPDSSFGRLVKDAFDGGPETVEIFHADAEIRIVVHSHQGIPLLDAQPTLRITGPGGQGVFRLPADFPSAATTWHAATICGGPSGNLRPGTGAANTP
jgi:hypothetical protein